MVRLLPSLLQFDQGVLILLNALVCQKLSRTQSGYHEQAESE
jgi:hypothetical protein